MRIIARLNEIKEQLDSSSSEGNENEEGSESGIPRSAPNFTVP